MRKIKFIKDADGEKAGTIWETTKKGSEYLVKQGVAVYIDEDEEQKEQEQEEEINKNQIEPNRDINTFNKLCVARNDFHWQYPQKKPVLMYEDFTTKKNPIKVSYDLISKHISGDIILGLSPFVDNKNVLYGGIDLDAHKPTPTAQQLKIQEIGEEAYKEWEKDYIKKLNEQVDNDLGLLKDELTKENYTFFINSSGSTGKHIRLYCSKPTDASKMKYFLEKLQDKVLGEVRHEVFPKQTSLGEKVKYGNQMKGVLAKHPRTGKRSVIIDNGVFLSIEDSLEYLNKFLSGLKNAREIDIEVPQEEIIKQKKKAERKEQTNSNEDDFIPDYCAFMEEIAINNPLPSGKATRHDYLDGNAYKYTLNKPEIYNKYCEMQGRDDSAFNNSESWSWSCDTIHNYIKGNTGSIIECAREKCLSCPNYSIQTSESIKILLETKDKDKQARIVSDMLKKEVRSSTSDIILNQKVETINFVTGISIDLMNKEIKTERKKSAERQQLTTKEFKKQKKLEDAEKQIEEFRKLVDDLEFEPLEHIILEANKYFQIGDKKSGCFIASLYIIKKYDAIADPLTQEIKIWTENNYYESIGIELIKSELSKALCKHNTRNVSEEIIHLVRSQCLLSEDAVENAQKLNLIPFKNCIYDLNTGKTLPHDKKYLFDFQIPHIYNANATCPYINKFMSEIVEQSDITLLNDIAGLILYRKNPLEKFFIFVGKGRNGKSKLINLYEMLAGLKNTSAIPMHQLSDDRFAIARTYKKFLNVGADISDKTITETGGVKSLCASDRVSAQFKFGHLFDFQPSATLLFSANVAPRFQDTSDGMHRRIETIKFNSRFGNEEDCKEDPTLKRADINLLEKISTEKELSGFINIALKHLMQILKEGQLSKVRSVKSLKNDYLKLSDNLSVFLEKEIEETDYIPTYKNMNKERIPASGFITIENIYKKYKDFCDIENVEAWTKDKVSKRIKKIGEDGSWMFEFGTDYVDGYISRQRSVRGIKWKQ